MRKNFLLVIMIVTISGLSGCGDKLPDTEDLKQTPDIEAENREAVNEEQTSDIESEDYNAADAEQTVNSETEAGEAGNSHSEAEKIAAVCQDIFDEMAGPNVTISLEDMRSMISRLGEEGYVVVDEENQIDMTGADRVTRFCSAVDAKEEAELTIIVLSYSGGFSKYDFKTKDGRVDIDKDYYQYRNGFMDNMGTVSYQVSSWQYTEEGYLLFEGSYHSESYYVLLLSDVPERVALRVQSLDEKCRELNRKYIFPVGYRSNNLFLADWNEEDFGALNFYDAFDRLYTVMYKSPVPYTADENLNSRAVYQIAEGVFESVIMKYFDIDSRELQSKTIYIKDNRTYEYSPRGFYESEYSDIPYPEVESYTENADGTITLTVNAVYPEEGTSEAFSHRVVVRPLGDGSFQYVSNEMITPEGEYDLWWHSERMTQAAMSGQAVNNN